MWWAVLPPRLQCEGIICVPVGTGETSRIWLQINEDERLEQIVKQVEKLEDVLVVRPP